MASNILGGGAADTAATVQTIIVDILLKFLDVIGGAIVLIGALLAIKFLKRYFARVETTHERQRTALNLLEKITNGFIIIVGITLALKVVGFDLTLIVSVLTLGLSFGMRDVIKNYVAGLLILFKSPFEIGDIVKIRHFTGKVVQIEFQAITIQTFDNKQVTIHNSDILTQPITNFSKHDIRRLEMTIALGYGSDMQRAMTIFDRLLANNPTVLKTPNYSIVFKEFTEAGMRVMIRFWVKVPCNPLQIRSELAMQIQQAFDEEKLMTPYTREAQLAGDFGMSEERRQRTNAFYGQPLLIDIVQKLGVTPVEQKPAEVVVENYADAEEPE